MMNQINPTKRVLQMISAILLIIAGIIAMIPALIVFVGLSIVQGFFGGELYLGVAILGLIVGIVLVALAVFILMVGIMLCKQSGYGKTWLAIVALILGLFTFFVVTVLMIVYLCLPDEQGKLTAPIRQKMARNTEEQAVELLAKYKKLLDDGVISQEEFIIKKRDLLG